MCPRTGRPTTNPKYTTVTVRLDEKSREILLKYCEKNRVEKSDAIRTAIAKLESDLNKA